MFVPQFAAFIDREEFLAMEDCFTRNWITEGPKAEEFVAGLKELLDVKFAVLAPNGTLAIYLALRALGIGRGDEVIVPDFTFIAAANAVEMTGAIPIFVDVREGTLQIDIAKCERLLTAKSAGTFRDAGCFSFFADKTLTTGEGGLVVTNREDVFQKLLLLRNQGRINPRLLRALRNRLQFSHDRFPVRDGAGATREVRPHR